MIIALTGTPGTGKTTVCEIIKEHSQYRKKLRIIDVNRLVLGEKLYTGKDEARDTYEADMDKLEERVKQEIGKKTRVGISFWKANLSLLCQLIPLTFLRRHPS